MSTRRNVAASLLSLPALASTASASAKSSTILPFSEEAARIIGYTLYAEARGEPFKGKMAVASVIQTRGRLSSIPLHEVCLKEKQFSCWNDIEDVPAFFRSGFGMLPSDIQARSDCYGIAWVLLSSKREWHYYTHFYNPDLASPHWSKQLRGKKTIGSHIFGYIS